MLSQRCKIDAHKLYQRYKENEKIQVQSPDQEFENNGILVLSLILRTIIKLLNIVRTFELSLLIFADIFTAFRSVHFYALAGYDP